MTAQPSHGALYKGSFSAEFPKMALTCSNSLGSGAAALAQ